MKVEGYFKGIKNANKAVDTLKNSGFTDCFSDMNDHYNPESNNEINIPGTDSGSGSLAGLVLKSGGSLDDPSVGPLEAASPMVSGMGGFEEIADINYKVIVNVDDEKVDKVKEIIKNCGGELENPNYIMPKKLENIATEEIIDNMIDDI